MWNWIKKLFSRETKKSKIDLSKMTKGDLKKLYSEGKITNKEFNNALN